MQFKHFLIIALIFTQTLTLSPFLCELCDEDWKPVCSSRGRTYVNKCHAICYMDLKYVDGECLRQCDCLDEERYVCGRNGRTYLNACMASCNGVELDMTIQGPCGCNCNENVDEVCGKNNVTYLNNCLAACDGVGVRYQGAC